MNSVMTDLNISNITPRIQGSVDSMHNMKLKEESANVRGVRYSAILYM
jgi:hypothetical protein